MLIRSPTAGAPAPAAAAVAPEILAAARDSERRSPPANTRQTRAAQVVPDSYDPVARTVEYVLSIGSPVRRWSFTEELEISEAAVDLSRVVSGQCPYLDAHDSRSVDKVFGSVISARVEGSELIGVVHFADTDRGREQEVRVSRGELPSASIGYDVLSWQIVAIDENDHQTWRAVRWVLLEASSVPVPADPAARVRSAVSTPCATPNEDDMFIRTPTGGAASAAAIAAGTAPAPGDDPTRAAPAPAPAPVAAPAPAAAPAALARFTGAEAVDFVGLARSLGVETRAAELVTQNEAGSIGVEAARAALLQAAGEHQRAQTAPAGSAARVSDERAASGLAIVDALVARALRAAPTEAARQYMGLRMLDLARSRAGLSANERDPITILRAANTTSDFPMLLEAVANKVLLARYATAVPTYRAIAARRDLTDFKPTKLLRMGDFPTLLPYQEDGEIKSGTINEGRESVTLGSFGRILRLTRQMIVNDDLGAFDDIVGSIGRMIARFENTLFWAMKAQNSGNGPKLSDGVNLFHANHGNLAGSGAAIDIAGLGAGRAALRKQKDIDGNILNLTAKTLLVGPDTETLAEQYTSSVQPVVGAAVNPFSGKLQVVAEGSIVGNAWELYADPDEAAAFSYGYLADAPGPRILTEETFNVDGVAFRATLDFYVGATDYRPAYRNPGA